MNWLKLRHGVQISALNQNLTNSDPGPMSALGQ
jgi:hypothetical protein